MHMEISRFLSVWFWGWVFVPQTVSTVVSLFISLQLLQGPAQFGYDFELVFFFSFTFVGDGGFKNWINLIKKSYIYILSFIHWRTLHKLMNVE